MIERYIVAVVLIHLIWREMLFLHFVVVVGFILQINYRDNWRT